MLMFGGIPKVETHGAPADAGLLAFDESAGTHQ
jgi:hypothetical protein